jgi:hypothetical protein
MDKEIIIAIIGGAGALLIAILGWALTHIQEKKRQGIKLCYALQPSRMEDDLIDKEFRTKTSESGYGIQIYNIGNVPFLFEQISLRYKKTIINDCFNAEEQKTIMPYESYVYQLSEQDYDAILYHCKKSDLKDCDVIACDVSGKKSKGKLDLILPSIQADFRY